MAPGLLALSLPQLPSALAQVFAIAQAALERDELARFSGTTAAVAIIDVVAAVVTTAHVGDSRMMIVGPNGEAEFETPDHKASDSQLSTRAIEDEEIISPAGRESSGAENSPSQASSTTGLSVSRSLGDLEAHNLGILSEPTIYEEVPLRPGMALIAASDGVWQKLPRRVVATLVGASDPQDSARRIVLEARSKWPVRGDADDITAVVVRSRTATDNNGYPVSPARRGVAAAGA